MKLANVCHILDLPNDVFPMDMAVNFLQTGNQTVKLEDQTFVGTTFIRKQMMSLDNLHPDIQHLCEGLIVVESEVISTNVQLSQDFQLTLNSGIETNDCCQLKVFFAKKIGTFIKAQ